MCVLLDYYVQVSAKISCTFETVSLLSFFTPIRFFFSNSRQYVINVFVKIRIKRASNEKHQGKNRKKKRCNFCGIFSSSVYI